MMRGQIVKGIAGFYFVKSGEMIYRSKARGLFKKQGMKPLVGDNVLFLPAKDEEDDSLITEILPRKNSFIRPLIANVDCFLIIAAADRPAPVLTVIDKLLVTAEKADTQAVICINKCDLAREESRSGKAAGEQLETVLNTYSRIYPLVQIEKDREDGLADLKRMIRGKTVAFAGASGVGKSTILNRLLGTERMETGFVSKKTRRGRHTTRHAEIFMLDDGDTMIFDTPGFTSFDLPALENDELGMLFPEIGSREGSCRYDDCLHRAEPGCAVKEALERGEIARSRYESYIAFLQETEGQKKY